MKKHFERNRSIITLIVIFLSLAFLTVYTITNFSEKSRADAVSLGESVVLKEREQIMGYISHSLDSLQNAAINVEYMMQNNADNKQLLDYLRDQTIKSKETIDSNFTGVYGYIGGEYLDGTDWIPDEDYVPTERDWYIDAVKSDGKPAIVKPYLDEKTKKVMLSISILLYDKKSVLSIDIVMDKFQKIAEEITLGGRGYGFICDTSRMMIAHSDPKLKGADFTNDAEMNEMFDKIFAINGRNHFEFTRNNIKSTVFADNVLGDWYSVVVINNDQLYKETVELTYNCILVSLAIFLVVVLFTMMSYRRAVENISIVEQSTKKVEHVTNAAMRALARAIDAKDKYTQGHSLRVAQYSREIAKRMGKDFLEQNRIYKAALLHDVGKIRIPDEIINKPGRLTDDEYAMIKLHAVAGHGILKDITEDSMPALCAKWHHERYDGKGYPNGISKESIPEFARIVAVADAYDAMASNRSYRNVLPQEVVRKEIVKGKGTQFDPNIADIMLEMIDEDKNYDMREKTEDRKNILYIDQNENGREMFLSYFNNEPQFKAFTANSEQEGIKLLGKNNIDLILIDELMHDQQALKTISDICRINNIPILPVINKNGSGLEKMKQNNISDYITKPISKAMLFEVLHSMLL